jgi:CheY-like chemotaxis protein
VKKILLLEDSKTIFNVLKQKVETNIKGKYEIIFVSTHDDFVKQLHEHYKEIDKIFLNKGVDNLKLVKALNKSKHFKEKPIVILTSNQWVEDLEEVEFDGILFKPFVIEDLKEIFEENDCNY